MAASGGVCAGHLCSQGYWSCESHLPPLLSPHLLSFLLRFRRGETERMVIGPFYAGERSTEYYASLAFCLQKRYADMNLNRGLASRRSTTKYRRCRRSICTVRQSLNFTDLTGSWEKKIN